jgi:cyclase
MLNRIIPCLLLLNGGLVKTRKFKDPKYLGDPINAVRIFNEKEVDELIVLDISATKERKKPQFELLNEIASECFMPLGYGGGITSMEDLNLIFNIGVEKAIINSYSISNPSFIEEASSKYGSQSIVVSIDVKKGFFGKYEVYGNGGKTKAKLDPVHYARTMEEMGAGEIVINSIDNDGMMSGYDIELIKGVSSSVKVPVVASGGAGKIEDLAEAIYRGGASAVAAGSLFVFQGKHRAVLINYPTLQEIEEVFNQHEVVMEANDA